MEKINRVLQLVGASASILIIVGCATEETITAEYVMPPAMVKDIKAIDTLSIITNTKLSGNAAKESDTTYANGCLQQSVAARFTEEGFYRSTDIVWGNVDGVSKMSDIIGKKESQHGYARFTTDSEFKRANLELTLDVKIDSETVKKNVAFTLKNVPYTEKKAGSVPIGAPGTPSIKTATGQFDVFAITGTGTLTAMLTDKSGKVVYQKTFPDLKYSYETNEKIHSSLPTNAAVVAKMIIPAVEMMVADLSPHKEKRKLTVNEDGNIKAVVLLKAQAFTEAISTLDDSEKKTYADYENLGLAYEIIGEYSAANEAFEEALKLENGSRIATDGIARITKVLAGTDTLQKLDAKPTDIHFKKPEFK